MSVKDLVDRVTPAEIGPVIRADPDDDALIACAIAARAALIISGDKRVRNLKHHRHIQIIGAAQALEFIGQGR